MDEGFYRGNGAELGINKLFTGQSLPQGGGMGWGELGNEYLSITAFAAAAQFHDQIMQHSGIARRKASRSFEALQRERSIVGSLFQPWHRTTRRPHSQRSPGLGLGFLRVRIEIVSDV